LPYQRGEIVREAVFNPRPPYVARTLLILNLLYFAYGAFFAWRHDLNVSDYIQGRSPPPQFTTHRVILELGAIRALWVVYPVSLDDEPARRRFDRIILACFLHIGLLHLFMNMYGLYSLGPLIEAMWGPIRFLTIYAIAGIVSGCLVVLIYVFQASDLPVPQMIETLGHAPVVAGASGCLFGIFAALCVWFLLNRQHLPDRLIEAWSRNITMNLVLLLAINFIPGVSWQGHLGGAIGGLLAALLLHVNRFSPHRSLRILALLGVPAIPIAFFAMLFYESQQFIALVGG
jgi:membrane associated rhomboid family serine protease